MADLSYYFGSDSDRFAAARLEIEYDILSTTLF